MMRIITIIAALIAGLAGLLMSVCGGYFFFATLYQSLAHSQPGPELGTASLMLIAFPFLVVGGVLCWYCFRFIGRQLSRRG